MPPRKLTDEQVIELLADTTSSTKELTVRYNIALTSLYNILHRRSYKHLGGKPVSNINRASGRHILNADKVSFIRNNPHIPAKELGKKYGVSGNCVAKIRINPCLWKRVSADNISIPRKRQWLSDENVIEIFNDKVSGVTKLANKFNVSKNYVYKIKQGKTRLNILKGLLDVNG